MKQDEGESFYSNSGLQNLPKVMNSLSYKVYKTFIKFDDIIWIDK